MDESFNYIKGTVLNIKKPSEDEEMQLHYLAREVAATNAIAYYSETFANLENYTEIQLKSVISKFVISSQVLKDLGSPRIFSKVPIRCFAPLWLATTETSPDEFKAMFSASSLSAKKKICEDTAEV